jgi:methylenetetrahydrofolate dehydrogenase (NADP+) / methenyltetrahydrofolate cyclohydrolase
MIILDGKTTSEKILSDLKLKISNFKLNPTLDIIIVGTNPSSQKYVTTKQEKAQSIGIGGEIHQLDQNSSTEDVLFLVEKLNQNPKVDAFMVQLPLPNQINTEKVLSKIDIRKDADGLSPFNLGLLFQKKSSGIISATALGIIKLLEAYQIDINGKNAVIVGRSPEVSIPLFAALMAKNATVTICHTQTQNLKEICQNADILISSIGKPNFFGPDFVKQNAVVIDVGFAIDPLTGKTTGDFNLKKSLPKPVLSPPFPAASAL